MMEDDDFKMLRGFDYGQTDRQTELRTFVNVESLSRLKIHCEYTNIHVSYLEIG